MRKFIPLVLIPAIALGGCSLFNAKRSAPDEFQVARNAPLVIPPDYSLTPPVAGTAALDPQSAQQQAIDARHPILSAIVPGPARPARDDATGLSDSRGIRRSRDHAGAAA